MVTGVHAWHEVLTAVDRPDGRHLLLALYAVLRTAVVLAFAAFTVGRAEPHRRARNPLAFAACAAALLAVFAMAGPKPGTAQLSLAAGDALAVAGCLWQLASVLVLGRCFGLLPEARGLVRRGPYRVVRHPVYLGEITALAGLTVAAQPCAPGGTRGGSDGPGALRGTSSPRRLPGVCTVHRDHQTLAADLPQAHGGSRHRPIAIPAGLGRASGGSGIGATARRA
jgi:protein-S-isoprenylcysteine O-methyltransferase Ste14